MRVAGHIVKLLIAFSLFIAGCVKYTSDQPAITNEDVQTVYSASAITHCSLSGINAASPITKFGQCWSSANDVPDYIINQGKTEFTDNKDGDYTSRLTGLFPKTTYYVRAYYITGRDTIYAKQITYFTTKDTATQQPPNVATLAAFGVSTGSFYIMGSVVSIGSSNVTAYGHCYSSTNATPTIADTKNNLGTMSSPQQYTSLFTSLTPHTTYYVRAYATNAVGTSYGNVVAVTTTSNTPGPTINVIDPTSGQAGTSVTITGTNFDPAAAYDTVKFSGTVATVVSASATQIVVVAPANGTTGNVTVATGSGTSNGVLFTYISGVSVYTCGSVTNGNPGWGYWKNAVFTGAPGCTQAYSITGLSNDIYVAGPASTNTPTYWKNGTSVQLSTQSGEISSIIISGTDIYCSGMLNNVNSIWKNGVIVNTLSSAASSTLASGNHGLFVAGSDIYAAGYQFGPAPTYYFQAAYWKNGAIVTLTTGFNGNARATAIYVSGSDVYVAGTEDEGTANQAPRLWKNGVSVPLTTPANSVYNNISSLLVTGSDVYVGGKYNGTGAVWKNGVMINTDAYALAEQVTSIFLYNNTDLYVSGSSASSGMNGYWKNGNFVEMDPGCTTAGPACAATSASNVSGIFVK